jgi:hypothetical protein
VIREGWGALLLWGAGVWSACSRGHFSGRNWRAAASSAALAGLGWPAEANDRMAEKTEDYARPARRARGAKRLVARIKKTKRALQEYRPRPDLKKSKSLHHDSALLHHLHLTTVMEKERCVRSSRNPLVLLHVPSPPHGTIGPFSPSCPRQYNRTSILPSYIFAYMPSLL